MRHDLPYLKNLDDPDPQNLLHVGALDEKGAPRAGGRQNVYDGYVQALQRDLWTLNFRGDFRGGVFDAEVLDAVVQFQRHAGSTLPRARLEGTPVVTFTGHPNGIADKPTREEIARWLAAGWYRERFNLAEGAVEAVFEFTAREATGLGVAWEKRPVYRPEVNGTQDMFVDRAYQFLVHDKKLGLRGGLLGFDQRSGWLGKLVKYVYECDDSILPKKFGDRFRDLYNALNAPNERARMATRLEPNDEWKSFFNHPMVERFGLYMLWEQVLKPFYPAAERNNIRTVKGLSFFFDVAWNLGLPDAELAADACGRRDLSLPVKDHLGAALYTLRTILPPGRRFLLERFERLAEADIDEQIEYVWSVDIILQKSKAPRRL